MKTPFSCKFIALSACVLVAAVTSFAQAGAAGPTPGVDPSLTHLFGKTTSFTAKCDVRTLDVDQTEKVRAPMTIAMLEGKMRVEVDLSQMKSKDMSPNIVAMMKQMGMDQVVSISRPDKKSQYIVYPAVESCVDVPLSEEDAALLGGMPKVDKTALGKETLDGHSCTKNKVILKYDKGATSEFTIWNAADLKDFPVQIQSQEGDEITLMRFSEISLSKPDKGKFEVPSGYKRYEDLPEFPRAVMQRMLQSTTSPK